MTGWQKFERFLAAATLALAAGSLVAWMVAWATGGGLWAGVNVGVAVIVVAFAVAWWRWRDRLPWFSGLILVVVCVGPIAYARVLIPDLSAQVASLLGFAALVASGMMIARRADRPPRS